jgi:hypothetical protein
MLIDWRVGLIALAVLLTAGCLLLFQARHWSTDRLLRWTELLLLLTSLITAARIFLLVRESASAIDHESRQRTPQLKSQSLSQKSTTRHFETVRVESLPLLRLLHASVEIQQRVSPANVVVLKQVPCAFFRPDVTPVRFESWRILCRPSFEKTNHRLGNCRTQQAYSAIGRLFSLGVFPGRQY